MFSLVEQHDIRADDVQEIHADCTRRPAIFDKPHPSDELEARGSLPTVSRLRCVRATQRLLFGPGYRGDMLNDPAIRAAARKCA